MRLIDADELIRMIRGEKIASATTKVMMLDAVEKSPTVDAIPIEWLVERTNETARPKDDDDIELNHALFRTQVEWERWKKEHATD